LASRSATGPSRRSEQPTVLPQPASRRGNHLAGLHPPHRGEQCSLSGAVPLSRRRHHKNVGSADARLSPTHSNT